MRSAPFELKVLGVMNYDNQPSLDRHVKAMTPIGNEAKRGYAEHKQKKYDPSCKWCRGKSYVVSAITKQLVPCPGCQE